MCKQPATLGIGFLLAATLAAMALLAGCPAKSPSGGAQTSSPPPGTAAPDATADSAQPDAAPAASAADLAPGWPLAEITLPAGAVATRLPDSIAKGYQEPGEATSDGSGMHFKFAESKMDYWYAGFGSSATAPELQAHFDACASAAGLSPDAKVNGQPDPAGLFQLLYSSADGKTGLRIYQDPGTPAGSPPLYVIFLQTL